MSILKMAAKYIRREKGGACRVCGTCCEVFGPTVKACEEDLERWQREGREDIIAWLTAEPQVRPEPCPFLVRPDAESGYCGIDETKPAMCRAYPTSAHGFTCVMRVKHDEGHAKNWGER